MAVPSLSRCPPAALPSWTARVDAVTEACRRCGASRAWVIGSAARGEADDASDLDVVVEWDLAADWVDRPAAFRRYLVQEFPCDVLVYRPKELRGLLEAGQPFLTDAWRDARLVWDHGRPAPADGWLQRLDEAQAARKRSREVEDQAVRTLRRVDPGPAGIAFMYDPAATAENWLRQAEAELKGARTLRDADQPSLACFLAQQAAEKALKAFLVRTGDRRIPEHDTGTLAVRAQVRDARFAPLLNDAVFLERFYVATRYPDAWPGGGVPATKFLPRDADDAIAAADRLLAAADAALKDRNGPQP